jgi:ABC-type nitrate/sulfonate/bicarbonate transport system substrate-binding protein
MRIFCVHHLPGLLLGARLGIGLCLAGFGTASAASLTMAVARAPMSLPFYVALQQGYFRDEGLDLILADCLGVHRCLRQVQEGRANFATASDVLVAVNAFRGRNWRMLAAFASSQDDLRLVVRNGKAISAPSQLVGLRVGIVPSTASQYFFDALLLNQDVDPHAVKQIPVQPEDAAHQLALGHLDAVAVGEPFATQALKAVGPAAAVLVDHSGYRPIFAVVSARLPGQPGSDQEVALLRGLDRAIAYIQREPRKARETMRQRLQLHPELADRIFAGLQFRLNLDANLAKGLESLGRWAVREHHVQPGPQPDFSAVIDVEPLRRANPQAVASGRQP